MLTICHVGLDRISGVGQYQHCKDGGRLEAFAKENFICHRHIDLKDGQDIRARYKFCPEGSPFEAKVRGCTERYICGDKIDPKSSRSCAPSNP